MRIMPCTPYQQQINEHMQKKSGTAAAQQPQKPRALRQSLAEGKPGGPGAFGGGMTLNDILNKMLPGGIGGLQQAGGAAPPKRTEAVARKLSAIDVKMKTGQPLTDEELKVLEKYNPEAYQEAKKIEAEREQYRKELEGCRSKEDVEKLRRRKLSQFSGEVNAIRRSGMPQDDKIKAMRSVQMRMAAADNEFGEYTSTAKYKSLPEKRGKEKSGAAEAKTPEKPADQARTAASRRPAAEAPAAEKGGVPSPAAEAPAEGAQPAQDAAEGGAHARSGGRHGAPSGGEPQAPPRLDVSA